MATLDEIGQEKQRISERLARIDAERTKLADQLNELEITERVLTRFGGSADTAERRRRGRPARTAPAAAPQRRARGGQQAAASVSLSDATLQAVKAHPDGATANGHPQSLVAGIRHDGPAEPPRYRAATAPARWPARKPRSALVPAGIGAAGAIRARRDGRVTPRAPDAEIGPQQPVLSGTACGLRTIGRAEAYSSLRPT